MSSTPFERPFVLPPVSVRAERLVGVLPLAFATVVIALANIATLLRLLLLLAVVGLASVWLRTLRGPAPLARWRSGPGWGLEGADAIEPATVTPATRVYAGRVLLELRAADGRVSRHLVDRRTLSAADRRRLRVRLWLGHG
jgi:hypothetical protein